MQWWARAGFGEMHFLQMVTYTGTSCTTQRIKSKDESTAELKNTWGNQKIFEGGGKGNGA
jgi:hypothetical protein